MQLRKSITDITIMILVFAPISLLGPVIQDNRANYHSIGRRRRSLAYGRTALDGWRLTNPVRYAYLRKRQPQRHDLCSKSL